MRDQKLLAARAYEKEMCEQIPAHDRPKFHMTPQIGWTNDPNGFSFYKGEFHLFYQSNPYNTVWDSMHWGHVSSKDLLQWQYLPCALAPEEDYDDFGVFSGSAIDLPDGRHLLMYTGVSKEAGGLDLQRQCVAVGDGLDYQKYENNPVLDESDLPEGMSKNDFRDPKIWQEADGSYRCVVGTRIPGREGAIVLFSSPDGFSWKYESILIQNDGRFGAMWECPDFFQLEGKHVLLCSPQEMVAKEPEYFNGHGTLCLIGQLEEGGKHFAFSYDQTVDYGMDFYAPQTTLAPDGRRIMIGWMQNWDTCDQPREKDRKWFGQMTLPRELTIRNGRLCQNPVRELQQHRSNKVEYKNVTVSGAVTLEGIRGRTLDMEITIRPKNREDMYRQFSIWLAKDENFRTELRYDPVKATLELDRQLTVPYKTRIDQRCCPAPNQEGEVKLHMILDRFSAEIFVNDGQQVMTTTVMTHQAAQDICFIADGQVEMDIVKYDLFAEA